MKTPLLLLLSLTLISAGNLYAQPNPVLPWTSNDDRVIQARFIGVGSQSVLIEKDGVVFNVPFTRLSSQSIAQAKRLGGTISQRAPASRSAVVAAASGRQPAVTAGLRRLPSGPEWHFLQAYQQGADVVVHHTTATVFGHDTKLGVTDPNDNGRCASGRGTHANPGIMGCALPVSLARRSTVGSPFARIPGLPWFTQVEVTYRGRTITVQLIDNGPSAPKIGDKIPAGIDLTPAACLALGIPLENIRANRVSFPVSFRVLGAMRPSMLASN